MRLALVIPWFGRDIKGGAEQQAWQVATRLAARGHAVDVLTTCCRSHQDDWSTNHLPAGATPEPEGFTVRRFPVEPRDRAAFDRACGRLLATPASSLQPGVSPVDTEDSRTFVRELIKSPELLRYLEEEKNGYDWFILLPYLYGPVIEGVEILRERAALQPCLHDEAYAYLPEIAQTFQRAGRLLFNSEGEQELAVRLFGAGVTEKARLVGEGVEVDASLNGAAPSSSNGHVSGRYVLYLGRKEEGKNVPLLLNAFRRFRAVRPNSDLRLLLAGNGTAELGGQRAGSVEDLGLVAEERKHELLRDCVALFQPSGNESFSRVMMEAWMHGKPVAAHGDCLATATAVERSRGGWVAHSEDDWAALFATVARTPGRQLEMLGDNGRRYASRMADWDKVMERYEDALALSPNRAVQAPAVAYRARSGRGQVNQFLPNLAFGDAISNHAIWIRDQLRASGFESELYVRYIDPRVAHECKVFSPDALQASEAAIYHHSVGTEMTSHLLRFDAPRCLVYHNITPAEFFAPFRPDYAAVLARGREELRSLASRWPRSCAVSAFNARELQEYGFANPSVLPIPVDPQTWNAAPDARLMAQLKDGRTNILFVGRIAPNKKHEDLLAAFAEYLKFDPDARLILVGKPEDNDPYYRHLEKTSAALHLQDAITFAGSVNQAQLAACYRAANLFWSMSEHEGFCVPLIEAMWFDVPVLAFGGTAIPETLGDAGIMFNDKRDMRQLAGLAHLLITDRALRDKVIAAQRRQRTKYVSEAVAPQLAELASELVQAAR